MVIDLNVQYNGGFLPDTLLLLTQASIIVVVRWHCDRILLLHFQLCTVLPFFLVVFGGLIWRLMDVYSITVGLFPTL